MSSPIKLEGLTVKDAKLKRPPETFDEFFVRLSQSPEAKYFLDKRDKKTFRDGYEKGKKEGWNERNEEVLSLVSTLEALIEDTKKVPFELVKQFEPQVVHLSVMAAEKILARELISGSVKLSVIIHPIIQNIPGAHQVRIRVNPDDLFQLHDFKSDLLKEGTVATLEILGDASISRGGCFIQTNVGTIDATLETRMKQMGQLILEE